MPLVIHLRKNQTAILNGAMIENVSGRTISIAVKNDSKVLRSDDMLEPENAVSPATRVYFALQCAYLTPDAAAQHLAAFHRHLADCVASVPGADKVAAAVLSAVEGGNLYAALKAAQTLVRDEVALRAQAGGRVTTDPVRASVHRFPAVGGGTATSRAGVARS